MVDRWMMEDPATRRALRGGVAQTYLREVYGTAVRIIKSIGRGWLRRDMDQAEGPVRSLRALDYINSEEEL